MIFRRFISVLLTMMVAACAGSGTPVISTGERFLAPTNQVEDYKLGVGDKIRLTVFNEPTLSGEFAVSADGTLSLPLVGDIAAIGKGVAEIGKIAQQKLGEGYLRNPKVSAEVTVYRPFFVLGEVHTPGQYPYVVGMTATNAIALAQGFTPRGVKKYVFIRQAGAAQEQAYALSPELRVLPGDTVRVAERYF